MNLSPFFRALRKGVVKSRQQQMRRRKSAAERWTGLVGCVERLEDRTLLSAAATDEVVAPITNLGSTFDGIDLNQDAVNNSGQLNSPPNASGAVSGSHTVSVVNSSIEWHTKGGAQQNSESLTSFFSPLNPADSPRAAKVLFDQFQNRFVVVAIEDPIPADPDDDESVNVSRILIAVSNGGDPNSGWNYTEIDAVSTFTNLTTQEQDIEHYADTLGIGVDSQALYITSNMFSFDDDDFGGVRLWIASKSSFYFGGTINASQYDPYENAGVAAAPNGDPMTTTPAHVYGSVGVFGGTYLVAYSGLNEFGIEQLQITRVNDPLNTPSFAVQTLNVGDIDFSTSNLQDAPQASSGFSIDTGNRDITNAVWRDGNLYTAANVLSTSNDDFFDTTAHWWKMDASGTGAATLIAQGDVGGEDLGFGTQTFNPGIAVDGFGNIGVSFNASGFNIDPGAYFAGLLFTELGQTPDSTEVEAGRDGYFRTLGTGINSIGEFSTAVIDPIDDTFWTFNQYALPRGIPVGGETGVWGTTWGNLEVSSDPTPRALPFARLRPFGSGIFASQNNTGFLFDSEDELNYSVRVDAGETVAMVLQPLNGSAQVTVELVELGLSFTNVPGEDLVIPATTLPQSGDYTFRVTANQTTEFSFDVIRNATIEAIVDDTFNGNELDISNSLQSIGAGRYAVVGNAPRFIIYEEDFDSGLGDYEFNNDAGFGNGLWHLSSGRSEDGDPFHTPPNNLYFGQNETEQGLGNYISNAFENLGGEVISPTINLPNADDLTLSFRTLIETTAQSFPEEGIDEVLSIQVQQGTERETIASSANSSFDPDFLPGDTFSFWTSLRYDLSKFAGQNVELVFSFQSPGDPSRAADPRAGLEGWYIDDVRVEGDFILERDEYELDLTGRVGESIDILLAGQEGADFTGETLQLLDPSGNVVATATSMPAGENPSNYDLAINDFVVPQDGIYTLRLIVDGAGGEYSLVVTDGAAFEYETTLPADPSATYRSIDPNGQAIGYTGAIGTPGFGTEELFDPGQTANLPDPAEIGEIEPNDSPETATEVPLGFDAGENRRVTINGHFAPGPVTPFATSENNGSIVFATTAPVPFGGRAAVESAIGDGPHGNTTGDFDVYAVRNVSAFETISIDVLAERIGSLLDPTVALYDADGNQLAFVDDIFRDGFTSLDSSLEYVVREAGDYFFVIAGFGSGELADPFDSGSGQGRGSTGFYRANISRNSGIDFYEVELNAGDVIGATVTGAGTRLSLRDDEGFELIGSSQDLVSAYPSASPLPGGGNATFGWVVAETGTYYLAVSGDPESPGDYEVTTELYRPYLENRPTGEHQILFLDFDGEFINEGGLGFGSNLSPLSDFLPRWGLTPQQEDAVIDAIIDTVEENLIEDVLAEGNNPNFELTILNSRDHADPFGLPNVSRVIIGGTIDELGINTIGIAESIDPGNYDTEETAIVLLDLLSGPGNDPNSLNQFPIDPSSSKIELVGIGVGNIVTHEAAHLFGAWHTDQFNNAAQIIDQGGNLPGVVGVGPDGIFGTADDIDVDLGTDEFVFNEGFSGFQDSLNVVAFGLTTGQAGLQGDIYEVELDAGDVFLVETVTPLDDVSLPGNSLDPMINLIGLDGETVIGSNTDSAFDGKNARLFFQASTAGTYRIQVLAESGFGEYALRTRLLDANEVIAIDDGIFQTNEDVPLNLDASDLLNNDFNYAPGGIVGYSQPSTGGTLEQNADGSLTYTPPQDYNGPASFTYTISPDGELRLTSGDADAGDAFGRAVAIDGDLMAITAIIDDENGTDNGAVYIFRRVGDNWVQEAKIMSSTPAPGGGDRFGYSVDLKGDFLVVGSVRDDGEGTNAGAAFVYRRVSPGNWVEEAKLTGNDTTAGDFMGSSVAIDGNTVVVGSFRDDTSELETGSAYVFTRTTPGGVPTWSQQAKLVASDAGELDRFGQAVDIEGNTILVGAYLDDEAGTDAGAAYVFTRFASFWTEQTKILATNLSAGDNFGSSVALSGSTAVIGSPGRDTGLAADQGAAYVFVGGGSSWSQQAQLIGSDSRAGDEFGRSVAIDGNEVVIGAPLYDGPETDAGAAYLFDRDNGLWLERGIYRSSESVPTTLFGYGYSVATSNGDVVIGASEDDVNDGSVADAGAAYVYSTNVSSALVSIDVAPVADPPRIDPQQFEIEENSPAGTFVGQVIATDPDAGQTLTYAIIGGNVNNAFRINALTGVIEVNNSTALDFETSPAFNLTVRVTDNGNPALSSSAAVTINLLDVNENPATIGDFVFRDTNANGVRDAGEFGVPGVTVRLYSPGEDGQVGTGDDAFLAQVETNKWGVYRFESIPPGDYFVEFVAPAGQFFTAANQGGDDEIDSDANPSTGRTGVITLPGGVEELSVDAGLLDPFTAGVGDRVFRDSNDNGVFDPRIDRGVGNVEVQLFWTGLDRQVGGGDDALLATTFTDKFGVYSFENLPEGRYYLRFVLPAGEEFIDQYAGSFKLDSNVDPLTGRTDFFNLGVGEFNATIDAGVVDPASASIGKVAWLDTTPGGYRANSEPGVSGVQVNLFNAGRDFQAGTADDTFVATTTTGADGRYNFFNLPEGWYYLEFSKPPGLEFTLKDAVANEWRDSDVNPGTGRTDVFLLRARENNVFVDAGYVVASPMFAGDEPQSSPTVATSSTSNAAPLGEEDETLVWQPEADSDTDTAVVASESEEDEDELAALDEVLSMPESWSDV